MAEAILNLVKLEIDVTRMDARRYLRVTRMYGGVCEVLCFYGDGD